MKTFYLVEPGCMESRNMPTPTARNGEMLIKVETALTCSTDMKGYRHGHPKMPMPTPFGHEFSTGRWLKPAQVQMIPLKL